MFTLCKQGQMYVMHAMAEENQPVSLQNAFLNTSQLYQSIFNSLNNHML